MQRHLQLARSPSEPVWPIGAQTPLRIVLADAHRSLRRNLRMLLDAEGDVELIAEVSDLGLATRQIRRRRPHVLILDLHLPNGSGLWSIGELRRAASDTQIVVTSMERNRSVVAQAFSAGALAYVLKEQADRDLLPAVRAAARGEAFVSQEIRAVLNRP